VTMDKDVNVEREILITNSWKKVWISESWGLLMK
jgi:hypothetical protein